MQSEITQRHRPIRSDRASALVLVPAMTLVLLCLGGIAIDLSLLHGAHRAAHRVVSTAADDGASMLDAEHLQSSGELRIDPVRARRVALAQLGGSTLPGRLVGEPVIEVDRDGALLTVTTVVEIDHVMLRSLPGWGAPERFTIRSSARMNR